VKSRSEHLTWAAARLAVVPCSVLHCGMDREASARAIKRAEQCVIDGDALIARQKELIANLLALGLDATAYQNMLVRLERTQSLHVQRVSALKRDSGNTTRA
jgi:hypothetical protein